MLSIIVPGRELFNDATQEFITFETQQLQLEHSLVSLAEWESRWCKPFLSKTEKTIDEIMDYIMCMTINKNVPAITYSLLTEDNVTAINDYIDAPMTASKFYDTPVEGASRRQEQVTAELIYYWMFTSNIPLECQHWHLNRLFALIKMVSLKNQPPKKQSRKEIMERNAALNAARRKQLGTKG